MQRGIIIPLLLLLSVAQPVLGDVGIGLWTSTTAETFMEGTEMCVTYKVYNPFDTDVWGALGPAGDIANLTTHVDDPIFVPKYTNHQNGKEMRICFAAENIHTNCLVGSAFCRTCEPRTYSGTVTASTTGGPTAGSGSATSAASGHPMQITVSCNPNPALPFRYIVYAAGITMVIGAAWWVKKNIRIEIGRKQQSPVGPEKKERPRTPIKTVRTRKNNKGKRGKTKRQRQVNRKR